MKRSIKLTYIAIFAIFAVAIAAFTASAAGTSANVNSKTAECGDTVEFTVSLPSAVTVRSGAVSLEYDKNVLQFISGECKLSDATVSSFDNSTEKGAFLYQNAKSISGALFTVKFKVLGGAALGEYDVKMTVKLKDSSNADIDVVNNSGKIKVCKFTAQNTDGAYQKVPASCESGAVYYYSCEHCGERGGATFVSGSGIDHSFATVLSSNETHHWYACTRNGCDGKKDEAKHSGGEATCTAQAVCSACQKSYGDKVSHSFTVPKYDSDYHWNKCANCDAADTKQNHKFGGDLKCSGCDYTLNGGAQVPETVTVTVNINGATSTITAVKGESVTLTYTDIGGYTFGGWEIDGTTVSADKNYTFAPEADTNVKALCTPASGDSDNSENDAPNDKTDGLTIIAFAIAGVSLAGNAALGICFYLSKKKKLDIDGMPADIQDNDTNEKDESEQ